MLPDSLAQGHRVQLYSFWKARSSIFRRQDLDRIGMGREIIQHQPLGGLVEDHHQQGKADNAIPLN